MLKGSVNSHFQELFMKVPIPLCWAASNGVILKTNVRFKQIFGYTRQDMPTLNHWWHLAYPDAIYRSWVQTTWNAALALAAAEKRDIAPTEYKVRCKSGQTVIMEISGVTLGDSFLATFIDVTERNAAQERAQQLAFHDPLTQLPNRRLLTTRLEHLLVKLHRSKRFAALMVVDLDHFKPLNDSLGHAAGDHVLVQAARRMVGAVRAVDTVARTGGDEFVVLLDEIDVSAKVAAQAAIEIAQRLQACLAVDFDLTPVGDKTKGLLHSGSASIGVVLIDSQDTAIDSPFSLADTAMYEVKRSGGNGVLMAKT
ncbi:sensor domain-containing diguanylate cyclase [Paucibacter sp. Y2R2-4]|uniref:sensor domain-containing diguanylate cyclase n=1 Tax=Paucibacter sp. Y2R2-4 TaxID=2893553 RepID=UPI0021E50B41|nr:sensor domain-containing diguanylate cyclase [Paucibacter sp. Y2R2-4]MCV2351797.1 sensor domain-containing diguanylate cyclase [Paucibacter sp. Y2R2-4]